MDRQFETLIVDQARLGICGILATRGNTYSAALGRVWMWTPLQELTCFLPSTFRVPLTQPTCFRIGLPHIATGLLWITIFQNSSPNISDIFQQIVHHSSHIYIYAIMLCSQWNHMETTVTSAEALELPDRSCIADSAWLNLITRREQRERRGQCSAWTPTWPNPIRWVLCGSIWDVFKIFQVSQL